MAFVGFRGSGILDRGVIGILPPLGLEAKSCFSVDVWAVPSTTSAFCPFVSPIEEVSLL